MKLHRLASVAVLGLLSWPGSAYADAITDWNEIAAASVAAGRPGPIGQTDLALVQVAAHDALQSYEKRFEPYYAEVKPVAGSKVAAAVAAVHGVLVGFYPAQAATLDATYATYLANNGLTGNAGIAVGEAVAARILPLRRLDPNPLPAPFTGGPGIGEWRPTPPANAPMATPWLGALDPFTLTGPARHRAPPPPDLTSDLYTTHYNEVKAKGALNGSTRTAEQTDIGHFWTDNFAVQWNRAIRAIVLKRVPKIGDRARLFALANLAGADALITAWDSKKHYNFWRPSTAIQNGELDGNPNTAGDPLWESLIPNPPYPDYTSGANNITGAMTKSLELFFGMDNIPFEVTSNAPLAVKKSRTYSSFSQAAAQVVTARVYLGIHFRFADTAARTQGRSVAEFVHDHFLLPVSN
ncbi:MAG TPA: vanadium-dependent haloperoxidase [Steroidobacteraceae bacterium]